MKKLSLLLASAFAIATVSFASPALNKIQTKQADKKTEKKSTTAKKSDKTPAAKKSTKSTDKKAKK